MDRQIQPSQEIIDLFTKHGVAHPFLEYYAWPQVFGSTKGPRPGLAGQAMTTFTVIAWVDQTGAVIYECNDMYYFSTGELEFQKPIEKSLWQKIK